MRAAGAAWTRRCWRGPARGVIAIDISEGCAKRARQRAERYGLDYLVVVADVEHLPIAYGAADIGYVHDGLHHLAEPTIGLRELARVANERVSINEPAEALGTALMVKRGWRWSGRTPATASRG